MTGRTLHRLIRQLRQLLNSPFVRVDPPCRGNNDTKPFVRVDPPCRGNNDTMPMRRGETFVRVDPPGVITILSR